MTENMREPKIDKSPAEKAIDIFDKGLLAGLGTLLVVAAADQFTPLSHEVTEPIEVVAAAGTILAYIGSIVSNKIENLRINNSSS